MALPFSAMPGPRCVPIFGSALNYTKLGPYRFERLHLAKLEYYQRYGRIYKEKLGPMTVVNLFDPVDIAKVFRGEGKYPKRPPMPIVYIAEKREKFALGIGSLQGEAWFNVRKSVQKMMMHPRAASVYLPAQNEVADDFLQLLLDKRDRTSGEVSELFSYVTKYAMESIGTVCFNTRLGVMDDDLCLGSDANKMISSSQAMFDAVQKTMYAFPWYHFFRTRLYSQFVTGKRGCNELALKYLNAAREKFGEVSSNDSENNDSFLSAVLSNKALSNEDAVNLTVDLFTAGIDSTASALSFALYHLAKNPAEQEKLYQEISTVIPRGCSVSVSHIDNMPYLKACIKESFRLNFPVEGGTRRFLEEDTVLGGYMVPKGALIAMNNQVMCLQEEYFERPEEFLPERWLKKDSRDIQAPPPFVMMPFGYGPRMCIGRRFAEQEIYLALIKIVQTFRMEYHHEPIGMINRVFTMPDKALRIALFPRD
ncbi:cytochrome P450 10-like [Lingula anatina]|uniref:Cytochrome P450 10-like n=1 Tax=Lingula anatina TaxID=7574 RepID=A0A1S3HJI1_LINAN|nr:cytochrome P450 10-like [Lingula anatina]|eukprot:XP_013386172.1 cytochrome P450 10-like [Lingula anatina]